jgi:hypothetical protein
MITLAWYTLLLSSFFIAVAVIQHFEMGITVTMMLPVFAFSGIYIFKHYKEGK